MSIVAMVDRIAIVVVQRDRTGCLRNSWKDGYGTEWLVKLLDFSSNIVLTWLFFDDVTVFVLCKFDLFLPVLKYLWL